jgi:pyruvate/2-oxoglutarate/acetoin dehydrogenase E1 component
LEHRELFNEVGHVPENYYETPFSSQIISIGNDATVVTVSATILDAAKARTKLLENYDISMEIIDLRWMRPIDISTILRSVRKTGRLLVVDTGWRSCSISSEIIALVCEKALGKLKCPPKRITLPDAPCPASKFLDSHYHPNSEMIYEAVSEMFYGS